MRFRRPNSESGPLTPGEGRGLEYRREVQRQLRGTWTRRRVLAWTCFVLAVLIAGQHMIAHLGKPILPFGMGTQDLVVGFPMAGIVALAGLFALEARPPN